VTPLDLGLAAAGRLAAAIDGPPGARRRLTWVVVTGLVLMSAIPTLVIGSSPRPTDLTFEDVRLERIPAMTTWVRLEGDLRVRLCRIDGSEPALEVHAPTADLLLVFDDHEVRDRLTATLR
jgi:hypothetical protein